MKKLHILFIFFVFFNVTSAIGSENKQEALIEKYNALVDARTDLTDGEKILLKHNLIKDLIIQSGKEYVINSSNPKLAAKKLAQGKTGINKLDALSASDRIDIVNSLQAYLSLL